MWTLSFVIYLGCKWLTWRRTAVRDVPAWKHAAYLLAWPGLDAAGFLEGTPARCRSSEWRAAAGKLTAGIALLFAVARLLPAGRPYFVGWAGMIGMVLILHFGVFHLLSCWWRRVGVAARPLMNRPLTSTSVSEFWGRRWNTAFRDLTYRFLFRPCTSWFGPRLGVFAGFLFSGAVHDLVISVPAQGGYGGPTIFFAVQGAAMMMERSRLGRRIGLGSGLPGWLFTMLMLAAPAGLLFHRPFVQRVILPFMRALGAV
ncbi:MAG: hypothetical protein IT165_17595 [Bryobacterales bacterium]|nr:hypothetical protein [Bryobacterales bacterium]